MPRYMPGTVVTSCTILGFHETKFMSQNFLVDSGADISVVKIGKLKDDIMINESIKINLTGIGGEVQKTLGFCELGITNNSITTVLLPLDRW